MKKLLLFIGLFLSLAGSVFAQGVSVSGQAIVNTQTNIPGIPGNTVLQAVPNAQITVCTAIGGGIPCSPLVTIYSNQALTVVAPNPFTADLNGNFQFWVAPGNYIYSQTAAGIVGQLFNITAGSGFSAIGGSIASGQVAYGTAANTIGGSPNHLWDNVNNLLTVQNPAAGNGFLLENLTPSTSSVAQASPLLILRGQSWNGTNTVNNDWTIQNVPVNGTNAGQNLVFSSLLSGGAIDMSGVTVKTGQLNTGQIFPSGNVALTTAPATGGGNVSSPFFNIGSSWWDGAAAHFSTTSLKDVEGSGTNPTDTTTISNVGAFNWAGLNILGQVAANGNPISQPLGTDSGVVNAYVVNPSPSVPLTATNSSCFNFTTANANTGASTINVSGTGVKNLTDVNANALATGAILASTVYGACYDGTEWVLEGFGVTPANTLNLGNGKITLFNRSNVATTGRGSPIVLNTINPAAVISTLLEFHQAGTNNQWFFDIDNDGSFVFRGSLYTFNQAVNFFNVETIENGALGATDLVINPSVVKTSGNAWTIQNNSGPILAAADSLNGVVYAGNKTFVTGDFTDSTSGTLVAITGLTWTLPVSRAVNVSFHCMLMFDQASAAVSDAFGVGVTGTAPTNLSAAGISFSGASGTPTVGNLQNLNTTTPTAVVTFTPSAITTIWEAELDGTIEQPSNATPGVFKIYASTTTGADNLIVKRGSYCTLF